MRVIKLKLFPSCIQRPRTLSFRIETSEMTTYISKTINSVYIEPEGELIETPESWFTNSSESTSTTTEFDDSSIESHLKEIIRGVQKSTHQRLLFEPGSETNSIISTAKNRHNRIPYVPVSNIHDIIPKRRRKKQRSRHKALPFPSLPPQLACASVMMSQESKDPYKDFKRSMEEVVESLGMKHDLEALEDLLGWYLKANDETNHGYIVASFVDLLAEFVGNNSNFQVSNSSSPSYSSAPILSSSASTSSQLFDHVWDHM